MIAVEEVEEEVEEECLTCGYVSCRCCSDCEDYPCVCCGICGGNANYCECCGNCESSNCRCDGHGQSDRAPWVARGDKIKRTRNATSDWQKIWPEIDVKRDPVVDACDFYLLEALTSGAIIDVKLKPSITNLTTQEENDLLDLLGITELKLRKAFLKERAAKLIELEHASPDAGLNGVLQRAHDMHLELIEAVDRTFVHYTHVAVGGEIRHHRAVGGYELNGGRDQAWSEWRDIYESIGNQALLDIESLFLEFEDDAYGGPPWAEAAKILYMRLEGKLGPDEISNKKLFVDRVFSMQHNGGQLLDKVSWKIKNVKAADVSYMTTVLDHHASEPPDILYLSRLASRGVRELFVDFITLASKMGLELRDDYSFNLEELMKQISKEPIFICRNCGSNPRRGHLASCDYISYIKGYIKFEKNELKYNNDYHKMRWNLDDCGPAWFNNIYPVSPKGHGNVYINEELVVVEKLSGYHYDGNLVDLYETYEIKAKDLRKSKTLNKTVKLAEEGKIRDLTLTVTVKDKNGNLLIERSEHANRYRVHSFSVYFDFWGFASVCTSLTKKESEATIP